MKPVLVLPTYNERDNIESFLGAALAAVPELRVIVVDDASPDGTGQFVAGMAKADPRVRLHSRPAKMGLGTAYREGFALALDSLKADFVVQMDADFSHDPMDIPRLLQCAGAVDLVIGSRHAAGGGAEGWPLRRHCLSRSANFLARLAAGGPVRDCTGGFRCYRAAALQEAKYMETRCRGFGWQVEMTARFLERGLRICELPITFRQRAKGQSKMSKAVIVESSELLVYIASRRFMRLFTGRRAAENGVEAT